MILYNQCLAYVEVILNELEKEVLLPALIRSSNVKFETVNLNPKNANDCSTRCSVLPDDFARITKGAYQPQIPLDS
jgi:hypothetical protein